MKRVFPGRASSSNEEADDVSRLCYDKVSSEDVSTLLYKTNTNDICLLCGEFGHNRELRHRCAVCSEWVHVECSSAETVVNFKFNFCA
jgi:hypothetical protein